ncbi:MAG: hypothetical protein WHS86_02710 [Desulfosoma sp.]
MLAVAVSKGRVAPVLDWCSQILLIDVCGEGDWAARVLDVGGSNPYERLERLKARKAATLICGAVSRELLLYAEGLGLRVLHGVAGEVEEVIRAYRSGRLDQPAFWLPGCGGPRRYRSCRSSLDKEGEKIMAPGKGRGFGGSGGGAGKGPGRGQGQGGRCRGGAAQGAGMGRGAQGAPAFCVCPACGEKVPHRQGVPCVQMTCPKCGKAMVRGDAT